MKSHDQEHLCHDPVHGYIRFTADQPGESSERQLIDNPWVQRLRHIHQLQTAWWVFPTAEHTRFQHVIGVMHLGSRAADALYDSLSDVCHDLPSRGYVESLLRLAGLLHDVGHGPFGHFFDEHFLRPFGVTHETLGAAIIERDLAATISGIRRTPSDALADGERMDAGEIAWLIQRPKSGDEDERPDWLRCLRSLLSGIYTIDNMDFVLRDAYMSGYSQKAFDLDRLLHYSFFSESGLTILDRGLDALVRFMGARAELFRTIYFHRTVRAIDLTLADLFAESMTLLFPGNPLDRLDEYQGFTESSLLVDVGRWRHSTDPRKRRLGERWHELIHRAGLWTMVCQRGLVFGESDRERSSIFSDKDLVEQQLRRNLPADLANVPLRVDIARHMFRPYAGAPAAGQNFLFDSGRQRIRPLSADQLFDRLPVSYRICRVYAQTAELRAEITAALDGLIGGTGGDDLTNM